MYQFMVVARNGSNVTHGTPTLTHPGSDVGDISTMSLTSRTNKWASRAVIALQLAAWSAVGIVLLEKGVASLQRMPGSFNASHEIPSPKSNIGNLSLDNINPLALDEDHAANSVEKNEYRKGSVKTLVDTTNLSVQSANAETIKMRMNDNTDLFVDKNSWSAGHLNNDSMLKKVQMQVDKDSKIVGGSPAMTMKAVIENWNEKEVAETEEESRWKDRKRSRFAKVVAGGAAAAAAMVAVGAVMLILGPAVIILRALDERRQERRFLKLSAEEDLPPSYEQATGDGEQAPTYSSLNLDIIVTSPSSLHNSTYLQEDRSINESIN